MNHPGSAYRLAALFLALLLAGCAVRLPSLVRVPPAETARVSQAFAAMLARQQQCGCCLDARAEVAFSSFWRRGSLQGFLQAMEPSYLKFVALSPLGQPVIALALAGQRFQYLSVPEATAYVGTTQAKAFLRRLPPGLDPQHSFFWLTGRLPATTRVLAVAAAPEEGRYWLRLDLGPSQQEEQRVLFELQRQLVVKRQLLAPDQRLLLAVTYHYPDRAVGRRPGCAFPARLEVEAPASELGSLVVRLADRLEHPRLAVADFVLPIPPSFHKVTVP